MVMDTFATMLHAKGMKVTNEGISLTLQNSSLDELEMCLRALSLEGSPDTYELAVSVTNKISKKYDGFLTNELLSADYASSCLDADGAFKTVRTLHASCSSSEPTSSESFFVRSN